MNYSLDCGVCLCVPICCKPEVMLSHDFRLTLSLSFIHTQKCDKKRIPTMYKSKLRTLLFFFVHFIYLSLAVNSFFFYTSPLKVCHHARCSFSVGSTCKVVVFVRGGFHTLDNCRRRRTESSGSGNQLTNTDRSGVTKQKKHNNNNYNK